MSLQIKFLNISKVIQKVLIKSYKKIPKLLSQMTLKVQKEVNYKKIIQ